MPISLQLRVGHILQRGRCRTQHCSINGSGLQDTTLDIITQRLRRIVRVLKSCLRTRGDRSKSLHFTRALQPERGSISVFYLVGIVFDRPVPR